MYPKRRIFLPLFLFCAYDSSVLQNFKIFTHLFPNFSYKDTRLTEVMCTTALTSKIGSEKFQKFKYGTFLILSLNKCVKILKFWRTELSYAQNKNRGKQMRLLGMDKCPSLNDIMEIRCNKCTRSEQGYEF